MTHFGPYLGPLFGPFSHVPIGCCPILAQEGSKMGSQIWPKMTHFGPYLGPLFGPFSHVPIGCCPILAQEGSKMGSQMGPQIWPLGHGPGAIFGGPRPETPDFHVQNGQIPGSGPWAPGGPYTTVYRGNSPIWPLGPWARGPVSLCP